MDLNIRITLTCDDYMTRLVDAVVRSLDAIDGAVAPMASAPKREAVPQPQPQPEKQETPEVRYADAPFPPAPVVQQTPAPAPAPAPAPTAKPEKIDLPQLRTMTKDWLRANSAHTKELQGWLAQQGLRRISDISTSAQSDSLKQLIKGA